MLLRPEVALVCPAIFETVDLAGYTNKDFMNDLEAWTTLEIWESWESENDEE